MPGSSSGDSDRGGKGGSSSSSPSSSSSESHGEGETVVMDPNTVAAAPLTAPNGEEDNNSGFADPESPNSKADSSSSEGVLVEHPASIDQDPRGLQTDQDGGILVNIDGSMLEHAEEGESRRVEELGREDMFVDAPDQLGFVEGRRSVGLEESMAVIEIGESTGERHLAEEVARLQAQLEDSAAECRRYKEERELFGSEIINLRFHLQAMAERHSRVEEGPEHRDQVDAHEQSGVDGNLVAPLPLHNLVGECSELASQLDTTMDELVQSGDTIKELHAVLNSKDQEIEDLNMKLSENSVSRDLIASYLDSVKDVQFDALKESSDAAIQRLLFSLSSVLHDSVLSEGSLDEKFSVAEEKIKLLTERYAVLMDEIQQLGQCLLLIRSDFIVPSVDNFGVILEAARTELVGSKSKESFFQERFDLLEKEKSDMLAELDRSERSLEESRAEVSRTKEELEQAENRFVTVKEKLSIAVTKGKSLVQQRDVLKQSLAEKANELEQCLQELQQKSASLEVAEGVGEELRQSKEAILSFKTAIVERENILHTIERNIAQIDIPEELQSADITGRIRWLVDQIKVSEMTMLENRKIKAALASFDFPETVSSTMLEDQINWLSTSLSCAKEDVSKMEIELQNIQSALVSCESQLLEAQKEIENLMESVFLAKQGKDSLQVLCEELTSKHEFVTDRLSEMSSEKNQLVRVLGEISEINLDDEISGDISALKEKCFEKITERRNAQMEVSSALMEGFQRMQSLLYVRSQELFLCEHMLEEEMIGQSERMATLEELQRSSLEVLTLRNEVDALQKDLERSEDRSSLLKEKLSMAVKKGKGLVQERENLKHLIDEKTSEIQTLKQELNSLESDNKEKIRILTSDLEQSRRLESTIKDERDQMERSLLESNNMLQKIIESIEQIVLPPEITVTNPVERLTSIAEYINKFEVGKVHMELKLEKQKEESTLQGNKLADAYASIKSLEDAFHEKEKNISIIREEMKNIQVQKDSTDLELEKLKEETKTLSAELILANESLGLLKDTLAKAEGRVSLLTDEKVEAESKSKLAIASLNAKIAAYMEELAGTHGNLENQSAEVASHLSHLRLLINDESLPSLMTEEFKKTTLVLRKMVPLVKDISSQINEVDQAHLGSKLENTLSKLLSLPQLEDYVDQYLPPDSSMGGSVENIASFTEVASELSARTTSLGKRLEQFSTYLNENINLLLQCLETTRDEVVHLVEHNHSLTLKADNLDAIKESQEFEMSKLQNDMRILLTACSDATEALQVDLLNVMDIDGSSQQNLPSSLESTSKNDEESGSFVSGPESTAQKLLGSARRVKGQIELLPNVKRNWTETMKKFKNKLEEAEFVADSVKKDRDVQQKRVNDLERELHMLKSSCNEMESNVEAYKAKESLLKVKEEELLSLQGWLAAKNREEEKMLLLNDQLEPLFTQVNKIEIPFKELRLRATEEPISTPIDKILYVLDNVATLQQMLNAVVVERDDLQSTVAVHVNEVEQLKKIVKKYSVSSEELEHKTNDLNELTVTLERLVHKFGDSSLEEKKAPDARTLLLLLERLMLTSSEESESSKQRVHELGTKLLASQKFVDELSLKVKSLEDSIQTRLPETMERTAFEAATSKAGSEISEIEEGSVGKKSVSPVPIAAHPRTMRKGSSDHLALNIDIESDRLISSYETEDKGHLFKSLNSSGLVPKQGKTIADRIDGIWVSGGRILMGRPEARMGIIAYSILLHLWVLATII